MPEKIIHTSSQVVYADVSNTSISEQFPFDEAASGYTLSKIITEQYLRGYSSENECAIYSLRLPGFFDGGGFVTYAISNALKNKDIVIWGDGTNKRQYM